MNKVQYLGCIVDEHGVHVDPTKIQFICLSSPDHTNQASELLGTCQLLPKVRIGIHLYFMRPHPSNQGRWKGKVHMGVGTTTRI
jgi:hypothetical protein